MFVCKKRLVLFTSLLFLSIGGMMMFNFHRMSEEEKLQAQIRNEQERMVLYAVNHYEGIEKIEFTSFEENKMTGVWSAGATINNEYRVLFKLYGFDGDLYMNYGPSEMGKYLKLKEEKTTVDRLSGVEIIYGEINDN
ncbi:ubiquitin C-terminal hydrolase [Streptococcus suis]|uniref:Ubiquitin C-terminal hydrolase n=3 Tax=Streptococcus TaxID=1301 RepID=A0A0Z8L4Q5_STRSU|nr:ubiquitin C-terminal hydrolase [Streptococcus suis]